MLEAYFRRTGWKRFLVMLIGNLFIGLGIAIFKLSSLGNDPFSGMNMALSARLAISFPVFQIGINLVYFAIELAFGRHYIGIGTIVNALLLGYFVTFFYWICQMIYIPETLFTRIVVLLIGMVICSFGLSLYQTSDVGIAPYDSLALIMHERFSKLPYFWARMICDGACALICFLSGGIVGLGTLVTAFGFGPVIHFFNKHFTEKLLEKELQTSK